MTQENDAVGRAQNINESFDAATDDARETFAQDWLNAEGTENVEANAAPRSAVVATLPDWTTFASGNVERRERRGWREILRGGAFRTSGVALAAFGLGVFCATIWPSGESKPNDPKFAATEIETGSENVETSQNAATDEASLGALTTIDSSTLRSVPNARSVDFIAQPSSTKNAINSADLGNGEVLAGNVGSAGSNGWGNGVGGDLAESTAPLDPASNARWNDDSSWRRGVDFQRGLENSATANVERFPTWDELETSANAPTVAETFDAPNGSSTLGAPNETISAETANVNLGTGTTAVADNGFLNKNSSASLNSTAVATLSGENSAGYVGYNNNVGGQGANVANLNGGTPRFAGNSQNSGYNQVNGSENFAGWPTVGAPVSTPNVASAPVSAPQFGASAPVSTAAPGVAEPPRAMVAQVPSENAPVASPNVPVANPNLRW